MAYQNLFNKLSDLGLIALESEMFEIIDAYKKDINGVDLFGETIPTPDTIYFKACTTKKDDGWMMCDCGNSGIDNGDYYIVTTEHLKCDEVPEKCTDSKTFAELVAKLLNEHYNKNND